MISTPMFFPRSRAWRAGLLAGCFAVGLDIPVVVAHEVHMHEAQPVVAAESVEAEIRHFRRSGDDHHLEAAWRRLTPALSGDEADAETLVLAATIAQSLHDFPQSLALLDRALEQSPGDNAAWLLKASIHLVRGEAAQARQACRRLDRSSGLVVLACGARVALVEGEIEGHRLALDRALRQLQTPVANADEAAWALAVAADLAVHAGDWSMAARHFERSLELQESAQVRAALADVYLSSGDACGALALTQVKDTALPILVRRLIAQRRCAAAVVSRAEVARVDQTFRRWIENRDWLHAREMARFYLDVLNEPALAHRLAVINLALAVSPD